jgi:hypothetical protein
MSAGNLSKAELASVSGRARIDAQEAAQLPASWFIAGWQNGYDLHRQPTPKDQAWFAPFLLLPTVTAIPAGEPPPTGVVSGVYALFNEDGRMNYVGQSVDVGSRVIEHMTRKGRKARLPFAEYRCVEVPAELMRAVEIAHIYALGPLENKKLEQPSWAFHVEAARVLRAAWGEKR